MNNYIFHIDLNAFYVRCEEIKNPSIIGKPVIIAGTKSRSVVSTASYEARQFDIHSGESVISALKKCPNALCISSEHSYYESLSDQFMEFIRSYTDQIEIASIDECYVDVSEIIKNYERPLDLAIEMQKNLFMLLSLKCSIGIAENKFLAKMASDMKKPMGITIIRPQEIKSKLWSLPIETMYGIGKKTSTELRAIEISTIGDLACYKDLSLLSTILGVSTSDTIDRANGIDNRPLVFEFEHKSFSQSLTFDEDVLDIEMIQTALVNLTEKLSSRLQSYETVGKLVSLSIRYDDYKTVTRSSHLKYTSNSSRDLFECVWNLYEQHDTGQAKRLLRVAITNLKKKEMTVNEINLFEI